MSEASSWRRWYDRPDEGEPCSQCESLQKLRWYDWEKWIYCIECWEAYGSKAARALRLAQLSGHCPSPSSSKLFTKAPDRGQRKAPCLASSGCAMRVEVTPEDTLTAAQRLLKERSEAVQETQNSLLPPVVLNMANQSWVGGGFLTEASGQEEEICRRSTVFPHLMEVDRAGGYPLEEQGAIVTPNVLVLLEGQASNYAEMNADDRFHVAVITAAAPCKPDVSNDEAMEAYKVRMREKISALLGILEAEGYEDVILGAWGCGAFRNPPQVVAGLFKDALKGPFYGSFRRVVFAVLDRPDWVGENNYEVFSQELLSESWGDVPSSIVAKRHKKE
eukprot:TRINITY_DN34260_c0_g1_i2.p1 TRINITY_DN34260_c0_g1~~TRINITY_DN34260_c0_g1_i2.p1  ORF type:complete len:333 (+),score=67.25 TRINITY_DN34260_c0_g1_i2:26-1024(+)